MTFENPENNDIYEIQVCWKHTYTPEVLYLSNGDPGYPAESDIIFDNTLIGINDIPAKKGTPVPEWITFEMIEQELDLQDCL